MSAETRILAAVARADLILTMAGRGLCVLACVAAFALLIGRIRRRSIK